MTESSDRLDRIEATVERISQSVERLSADNESQRKWEDRTWDVIKWVGGISAALSISAAIALVGLVIRLSLSTR